MTTRTLTVLRTHDDREIPVAGAYAIDPAHTSVALIGRHLMITKVRGRFPDDVEPGTSGTWAVTGDLTVRDVTRPVTLEVDFDGANVSPLGDERIAFSAATDIDREDWGLTWNLALETRGMLVGKKVRIELDVQAVASPRP